MITAQILPWFSKRKKEFAILAITIILFILVIGGIFEIILREQHRKDLEELNIKYANRNRCMKTVEDHRIYEYIPYACGTNSRGFFDTEHEYTKPSGVSRIVIIGDSIAAGQGVNQQNESFGRVLEKKLNTAIAYPRTEVIILAVTGYGTIQELALLKKEALQYDPNLIIWSYVLNDPAHPKYETISTDGDLTINFYKPPIYVLAYMERKLFYIREAWKSRQCNHTDYYEFLFCTYRDEIQSNIKKIGTITSEKKIPVLFLINPVLECTQNCTHYPYESIHKQLTKEAQNNNFIVIDILPEYMQYEIVNLRQYNSGGYDLLHPLAQGHKIIADAVYDQSSAYVINHTITTP